MIEKIGHVKNPLTVIAIFAGIAEISGTVVLPFIAKDSQEIYIWFLMLFPFFLVAVFFLTLNFNHRTLYSPSDYRDESNFVNPVGKATVAEQGDKLRKEVSEVAAALEEEQAPANIEAEPHVGQEVAAANSGAEAREREANAEDRVRSSRTRAMADVTLAERLAVTQLSRYLGVDLEADVRIEAASGKGIIYDAFGVVGKHAHAVDVKYFPSQRLQASRFLDTIYASADVATRIVPLNYDSFTLHLYLVSNASEDRLDKLIKELFSVARSRNLKLEVHTRSLNDLANQYNLEVAESFFG